MMVESVDDEVDQTFERALLLGSVVGPEGVVMGSPACHVGDPEEVLEAPLDDEGVALHVEEEVAPGGWRQRRQTEAGPYDGEQLVSGSSYGPLRHLEPGLLAQSVPGAPPGAPGRG